MQLEDEIYQLQEWIVEFIYDNQHMVASEIGHNQLVEQVKYTGFKLLPFLVKKIYNGKNVSYLGPSTTGLVVSSKLPTRRSK